MEWIDLRLAFIIMHVFGVALGAGAAFNGDLIFLKSAQRKKITNSEAGIMIFTAKVVWAGLAILLISGIGLVSLRPEIFLNSGKYWAKMTIVAALTINGILFHHLHLPTIVKSAGHQFSPKSKILKMRGWLVLSGAVSVISWSSVIILGVLGRTPFTYFQFLGVYLLLILIAAGVGWAIKDKIIST